MRCACTFSELEIPVCLFSPGAPRTRLKEEGVVNSLLPSNTNTVCMYLSFKGVVGYFRVNLYVLFYPPEWCVGRGLGILLWRRRGLGEE